MKTGAIYLYTPPSEKVYVGQTTNLLKRHLDFLRKNKRYAGAAIDAARRKHGPEKFKYEVLEYFEFNDEVRLHKMLDEAEKYYIEKYKANDPQYGYNISSGNDREKDWELTPRRHQRIFRLSESMEVQAVYDSDKHAAKAIGENIHTFHHYIYERKHKTFHGSLWRREKDLPVTLNINSNEIISRA